MASRWTVNPRRSRVEFTARQLGMTVKGAFTCVKGELSIDRDALERSSAHVVIDATSLETTLPAFAAVLEARDFLDVEHHPTVEFESGAISRSGDRYRIAGKLIFHGEAREVVVDAGPPDFSSEGAGDDSTGTESQPNLARISGRASLKGLVSDEELEVTIELQAQAAEAAMPGGADVVAALGAHAPTPSPAAHSIDPAAATNAPAPPEPEGSVTVEAPAREGRPLRILGLAGSYRVGSYTQALLRAAMEEAPAGVSIEPYDLRELPFYDADLEADGDPPEVRRLKEAIAAADGLLIATPEYNRGLPARLKNAIDWASRPAFASALAGRPVAVIGASTGRSGAANAVAHAKEALANSRARVLDQTMAVPRVHGLVDAEGNVIDPETRRQVARIVRDLAESVLSSAERAA